MQLDTKEFEMLATMMSQRQVEALEDELRACRQENEELRATVAALQSAYENVRFENHWMRQYILLSAERVRDFFSHIHDFTVLSAIKSFVLDMLPDNATAEQIAYTRDVMQIPLKDDEPRVLHVEGNYTDVHDNQAVSF